MGLFWPLLPSPSLSCFGLSWQIQAWEAHTDYIRYLEVHPTLPYVLSASDDMSVKLWDWDRQWDCTQVRRGSKLNTISVESVCLRSMTPVCM